MKEAIHFIGETLFGAVIITSAIVLCAVSIIAIFK